MTRLHSASDTFTAGGLLLDSARRRRRLLTAIERTFELWGYQPIFASLLDRAEPHEPFLQTNLRGEVYRLFVSSNEMLLLVPDITLFLARRIAARPPETALPLRLFYSGVVARRHEHGDIETYESLQAGVELIGLHSPEADLEILLLLCETLDSIGHEHFFCHLGSRSFLDATCTNQPKMDRAGLISAVTRRHQERFRRLQRAAGASQQRIAALWQLFSYIGDSQGLRRLADRHSRALRAEELAALDYLMDMFARLSTLETTELKMSHRFRLDLSEVGSQSYHTGIVFQVYIENHSQAVMSGGRYDRLLEHYGGASPAIGFTMFPHALLRGHPEPPAAVERASGADFGERYHNARTARRGGKATLL